jgi:DNA topoisomerase-6 subunit B
VVPIGEDLIRRGLEREAPNAELYVTRTRPPRAYSGRVFVVEVGLAYGGNVRAATEHVGSAAGGEIWVAGARLDPARRVDLGLLEVPGMTRSKAQELCHKAQVDPLKRAGALTAGEVERLRAAHEAELAADLATRPIELVRLANRVPLQYQQSACAITQAVLDTNWKRYGLQQPRGALPTGPVVLVVHIASVWVPYTSESKEAIAHYPEIIEEIQRGLMECGRQLGAYLNKRAQERLQAARRDTISLYAGELVEALSALTGRPKESVRDAIATAQRKNIVLEEETDGGEGKGGGKRAGSGSAEEAEG